jgi:hypothetical protein
MRVDGEDSAVSAYDGLALTRANKANENADEALSWGKRKNAYVQTVRLLGGALAAAAAVLALVDVAQPVTAAIAGGSAFASYLGQQQFAQNAAKDYAAAGSYKELAELYDNLRATLRRCRLCRRGRDGRAFGQARAHPCGARVRVSTARAAPMSHRSRQILRCLSPLPLLLCATDVAPMSSV